MIYTPTHIWATLPARSRVSPCVRNCVRRQVNARASLFIPTSVAVISAQHAQVSSRSAGPLQSDSHQHRPRPWVGRLSVTGKHATSILGKCIRSTRPERRSPLWRSASTLVSSRPDVKASNITSPVGADFCLQIVRTPNLLRERFRSRSCKRLSMYETHSTASFCKTFVSFAFITHVSSRSISILVHLEFSGTIN